MSQENKTKDKVNLLLKPSKNLDTSYYTSLNVSDQSNRFIGMAQGAIIKTVSKNQK